MLGDAVTNCIHPCIVLPATRNDARTRLDSIGWKRAGSRVYSDAVNWERAAIIASFVDSGQNYGINQTRRGYEVRPHCSKRELARFLDINHRTVNMYTWQWWTRFEPDGSYREVDPPWPGTTIPVPTDPWLGWTEWRRRYELGVVKKSIELMRSMLTELEKPF